MNTKKPKHPGYAFLWLLLIPAQLVIDAVLVFAAAYGDVAMADPTAHGHPAPALVILASVVAVILTIAVVVISLILVAARFIILNKRYRHKESENPIEIR